MIARALPIVTSLGLLTLITLWLAVASGCNNQCGHPDEPEYSCEPVAPGTPNSCGGPVFNDMKYDQDKAFPSGCSVSLPMCVEAFPNHVQTCECSPFEGGMNWVCPI